MLRTAQCFGCLLLLTMVLMTVSACGTQAHAAGPEEWQHVSQWASMSGMKAHPYGHNGRWGRSGWRPTSGSGSNWQPSRTNNGNTSNNGMSNNGAGNNAKPAPTTPTPAASQPTSQPAKVSQPTSTPTSAGSSLTQAAQAVFAQINQERAGAGLKALQWNTQLVQSAHQHNLTMAAANQLSHQLPGEPDFGTRERNAGVNWTAAAENIAYSSGGNAQSQAVNLNASMFAEQPPDDGHRLNILSSNTNLGVDVYVDAKGQVWLTEDFATL